MIFPFNSGSTHPISNGEDFLYAVIGLSCQEHNGTQGVLILEHRDSVLLGLIGVPQSS
jgi:hypothetical protein